MADIVLRDRNGTEVQYPGIERLKLNTVDGGTQNFAAFDPETLTPEKLAKGVTIGGVTGTMAVPEVIEDIPVTLDFSGGNQTILAPDGIVVKSAIIEKPANLIPGNIAEGVDIAGIVGTLAVGGGSNVLIKKCNVQHLATGIQTLVTAEELASVGFDPSNNKCFIGITRGVKTWGYLSSPGTMMNAMVFNFMLGSTGYGFYHYHYCPSSTVQTGTGLITANPFSGSTVNNTPYYADGEIRYNHDSTTKLYSNDTYSTSYDTIYVIAGNLTPTV